MPLMNIRMFKILLPLILVLRKVNYCGLWRHFLIQLFVAKPRRPDRYRDAYVLRLDLTQNMLPIIPKYLIYTTLVFLSCNSNMNKIDIQGHRGCRGLMPENTIPAFIKALDLGVHTLELDVVISKDKEVVVSHEPFFNHLISTGPDGGSITEENEKEHNLYRLTYEDIKTYDVGLKGHPGFPEQEKISVYKPLLSDVISQCDAYAKKKNRPLPIYNIEIKRVKQLDYYFSPPVEEFVDLVLAEINEHGISDRVVVQSFDLESLRFAREKYPLIPLALLIENEKSPEENINELGFIPDIYSSYFKFLDDKTVDYCHSKQIKVIPWTVNDEQDIKQMLMLKVDGIISDYPDRVSKVLESF